jgi:nitrate reductase assembly molybdenum cofactor insertion protein NarJ
MRNLRHYIAIAELFRYPDSNSYSKIKEIQGFLYLNYPDAAIELSSFSKYVSDISIDQWEELYTKTFDVQPISYLDIGYVLFVEDYKRGEFLVQMKKEQIEAGNDCGTELPDNLFNILTFIAKSSKQELVDELVVIALVPALLKMLDEFKEARIELKLKVIKKLHSAIIQEDLNNGNVYQFALRALLKVIEHDFEVQLNACQVALEANKNSVNTFFNPTQKFNS